jgi:protein-disulfide isomerase
VTARIAIAVALVAVAAGVAWWLDRSGGRGGGPVRTNVPVPHQVDRADFPRPDAPWLVVVFTSSTCANCQKAAASVAAVDGPTIATAAVPVEELPDVHDRYGIDAVPVTVVADGGGVVRASFLGAVGVAELTAAIAAAAAG